MIIEREPLLTLYLVSREPERTNNAMDVSTPWRATSSLASPVRQSGEIRNTGSRKRHCAVC